MRLFHMVAALVCSITIQSALAEESPSRGVWGGIKLRMWNEQTTASAVGQSYTATSPMPTLALGYNKIFVTFTTTSDKGYAGLKRDEQAVGIGYQVMPALALVIGGKAISGTYMNNANWLNNFGYNASYNTLTAIFNYPIPDSAWNLTGNLSYGKGSSSTTQPVAAQKISGLSYLGFEIAANTHLSPSTIIGLGLRSETAQEAYFFASGTTLTGNIKKQGLFMELGLVF